MSSVEPDRRRVRSKLRWLGRVSLLVVLGVVGLFVWGFFQPKPPGFAPTDPDQGAFVTDEWTRYTINATNRNEWVFFNFGQGRSVDATFSTTNWDLAFKRTSLLTNSGLTNPIGPGGAVNLGEVALESATVPSAAVFAVDRFDDDGEDDGDLTNTEISRWYNYSFITHTVHAKTSTYLVRSGDARDALVQFDSYYCEDEDAGCITFRYRLVPAT